MKLLIIEQLKKYRERLKEELYYFDGESSENLYVLSLERDIKEVENLICKVWECQINEK